VSLFVKAKHAGKPTPLFQIPEQIPDDELDIDTLFVADAMSSQLSGN